MKRNCIMSEVPDFLFFWGSSFEKEMVWWKPPVVIVSSSSLALDWNPFVTLSFDSVLITSRSWCSPLQHSLHRPPLFSFYKSEKGHSTINRRQWIQLPGYQTVRGYQRPANDCFWNIAKGRVWGPNTFAPYHRPLALSLHLISVPRLLI